MFRLSRLSDVSLFNVFLTQGGIYVYLGFRDGLYVVDPLIGEDIHFLHSDITVLLTDFVFDYDC